MLEDARGFEEVEVPRHLFHFGSEFGGERNGGVRAVLKDLADDAKSRGFRESGKNLERRVGRG